MNINKYKYYILTPHLTTDCWWNCNAGWISMSSSKGILLCLIPSNIGIKLNGQADSTAKSYRNKTHENSLWISYADLKNAIENLIKQRKRWTDNANKMFRTIKPVKGEWAQVSRKIRKTEHCETHLKWMYSASVKHIYD